MVPQGVLLRAVLGLGRGHISAVGSADIEGAGSRLRVLFTCRDDLGLFLPMAPPVRGLLADGSRRAAQSLLKF
jgi:hypothetical protein